MPDEQMFDSKPRTMRDVVLSLRRRSRTLTSRLKWLKKSAPSMAKLTSATTNTQRNWRLSPTSTVSERKPYVEMAVLFTACSDDVFLLRRRSSGDAGTIEISAPVSTSRRVLLTRSTTKNRRLGGGPMSYAAVNDWPERFPKMSKVECSG